MISYLPPAGPPCECKCCKIPRNGKKMMNNCNVGECGPSIRYDICTVNCELLNYSGKVIVIINNTDMYREEKIATRNCSRRWYPHHVHLTCDFVHVTAFAVVVVRYTTAKKYQPKTMVWTGYGKLVINYQDVDVKYYLRNYQTLV